MTVEDQETFQERINLDSDLRDQVSKVAKVLKGMESAAIRQQIKVIHEQRSQQNESKLNGIKWQWYYRSAAAI